MPPTYSGPVPVLGQPQPQKLTVAVPVNDLQLVYLAASLLMANQPGLSAKTAIQHSLDLMAEVVAQWPLLHQMIQSKTEQLLVNAAQAAPTPESSPILLPQER